jgi:hypothetical protein
MIYLILSLSIVLIPQSIWAIDQDENRYSCWVEDSGYARICENPYVNSIRSSLNTYIGEKEYRDSLRRDGKSVARLFQNDSVYEQYYLSPFVVFKTWTGPFGGIFADIVFVNNPESIFRVWVYKIDINEYQLRSIDRVKASSSEKVTILKNLRVAMNVCTF